MKLLPDILAETREGATARLRLRVPADLTHFAGHFPGCPILPGVVQVDWAVRLAERHFVLPRGRFSHLKSLKFTSPVLPGAALELSLTWSAEKSRLDFSFRSGERACAGGQIVFQAEGAA